MQDETRRADGQTRAGDAEPELGLGLDDGVGKLLRIWQEGERGVPKHIDGSCNRLGLLRYLGSGQLKLQQSYNAGQIGEARRGRGQKRWCEWRVEQAGPGSRTGFRQDAACSIIGPFWMSLGCVCVASGASASRPLASGGLPLVAPR